MLVEAVRMPNDVESLVLNDLEMLQPSVLPVDDRSEDEKAKELVYDEIS